jgi:alpha-N-acetylglucosamine transferase
MMENSKSEDFKKDLRKGRQEKDFLYRLPKSEYLYSRETEEIALRAAEMPEFQNTVKNAKDKFEALVEVRKLLKRHFPEIKDIPNPKEITPGFLGPVPNEFVIAKHIVDLLYEKK